jgi:hypothetical protein
MKSRIIKIVILVIIDMEIFYILYMNYFSNLLYRCALDVSLGFVLGLIAAEIHTIINKKS